MEAARSRWNSERNEIARWRVDAALPEVVPGFSRSTVRPTRRGYSRVGTTNAPPIWCFSENLRPTSPGTRDSKLTPLDGPSFTVPAYDWSFAAAKALHSNVVRIPWHAVRTWIPVNPPWLVDYLEEGVLGVVDGAHQIVPVSRVEMPYTLHWSPDSGVGLERTGTPATDAPSESNDDGWW